MAQGIKRLRDEIGSGLRDFVGGRSPVRLDSEALLEHWAQQVRRDVPPARDLSREALQGDLEKWLGAIAALCGGEDTSAELLELAHQHGLARSRLPGFTVDHVYQEYALLMTGLCEAFHRDPTIGVEGMKAVCLALNQSLRQAVRALSDNASSGYKQTESRFEQMVQKVVDHAIFMVDPTGMVSTWNEGCQRIKQYTAEEIIGRHFSTLYREEDRAERPCYNLGIARREGRFREEWWRRKKDGTWFWAQVTITALYAETGELRGFLKVVTDLTERKRFEDELIRVNRDLEQFATIAAHDLQEPLRTVTSFTQLIERRLKEMIEQDIAEYHGFVVGASNRMGLLINSLLDYAKSGGGDLTRTPVRTRDCLDFAVLQLRTAIEESGAEISVSELPTVNGDPTLLNQLFQNLIGNALKYRDSHRQPIIQVGASRSEDRWIFSIQDNGIGMSSADVKRVFRAFHRVHAKGEFTGSGLGLSICRRIVERHRGRIWAESSLGEGSTFFFALPAD